MSRSRPPTGKRRSGTRLRSAPDELVARAPLAAQPIVQRWLLWTQDQFSTSIWENAVEEARQGRLASLHLSESSAIAAVRGGTRPSTVTVRFPELPAAQWRQLLEALAQEAMSEASLLSSELPPGLLALAEAHGVKFTPSHEERVQIDSDPRRGDTECQRAGAIVCLCMLERMVQEPHIVFLLRGLSITTVLEQLRELRVMQVQGAASAHGDPFIVATSQPLPALEESLEEFWGSGSMLTDLEQIPPASHAPHALLRRLGPSPLDGKFPLVGLLASVYDVVADAARGMRDRAEHIDVNGSTAAEQ